MAVDMANEPRAKSEGARPLDAMFLVVLRPAMTSDLRSAPGSQVGPIRGDVMVSPAEGPTNGSASPICRQLRNRQRGSRGLVLWCHINI